MRTRQWQDKDGNNRYTTEVVADNLQMLGRKDDNPSGIATQSNTPSTSTSSSPEKTENPTPTSEIDKSNDQVDDLPF